jgi:uncharacterized protein (TIGR00369 family)
MDHSPVTPPEADDGSPIASPAALSAALTTGADVAARLNTSTGDLAARMGVRFLEATPERVVATMPVAGNTQPYGLLHGGASCVLAETLGSIGAALHGAGRGLIAVGVDINATHHRGVRDGLVTGTATAVALGSTIAAYEIVVADDAGRRVCTARLTCLLRNAS